MYLPDKQKFLEWQTCYSRIPVIKKINISISDFSYLYRALNHNGNYGVLLESGLSGNFSYIGVEPEMEITAKNGQVKIRDFGQGTTQKKEGNPLDILGDLMRRYRSPHVEDGPDWQGGAAGYFSYDMVHYFEKIPQLARDDLELPDLYFLVYRHILAYHHQEETLFLTTSCDPEKDEDYEEGIARLNIMEKKIRSLLEHVPGPTPARQENEVSAVPRRTFPETTFSRASFVEAVKKVQDYIRAGDVFQVNLSVRQQTPLGTDPWNLYQELRRLNPSPYMGYLDFPEFRLVSGSPEQLVKVKNQQVSTRPIAGTRPRGTNPQEDEALARELINHEKERAEHIMLVDLERNDLGRVCRYGTVKVDELMVIEKYSHVMHIVSNVTGELRENCNVFDVVRAVFPGGTITGAPKIRTMEIIEELEPVRRGPYTGSIGWIGFDGDMELNIVIRTLLEKEGMAYVQAGAGIVIDSIPDREYDECLKKAEALWAAMELGMKREARD
ncbi:MAG: aminodeoxychorismate synthase, component I [Bacillaceae bacterium]|nr:aminodeoxychorismate synthase, component I [Bacillaceae bacterium]